MARQTLELARRDGTEFRSVRLNVSEDDAIQMEAQDIGPAVAKVWGDDEYEFWVRVEATAISKLAFELLREKFAGRLDAVDAFRNWCKAHGIAHEFGSWP